MVSKILAVITAVLVLGVDRLTKVLVSANLTLHAEPTPIIPGVIDLTYIHNRGGAWGVLSTNRALLIGLTVLVMGVCIYILIRHCKNSRLLFWTMSLVLAGGAGNMYDRIFCDGNVTDFLQFAFWRDFPVFNIADIAVVIGCCLLVLYYILDFINGTKQNAENND